MEKPEPRLGFVAGSLAEFLGISAGKVNGSPVGILTFRPRSTSPTPLNLMVSKAHLERLREDIDFLLQNSPALKSGDSLQITLAEIEAIHQARGI
jgi:hypothetical protein